MEPLQAKNPNRFVIFPIRNQDLWEFFQLHRRTIWNESEIDLEGDLKDWKSLKPEEQHFIKHVLAFFAASDGIVLENLALRFFKDIEIPEARSFYAIQMFMETVHSIMYSQLIDAYIENQEERSTLFRAIETIPSIQGKAEWALKWIEGSESFAERLVAFACVEGIFFSGSFCCIYWLKERGIMSGLCKSNDFIARDEGLHTDFAVLLYANYVQNKLTPEVLKAIVSEAVAIEVEFITESLKCSLLGMNCDLMTEYIHFVANRLVQQLGYKPFYEARQPFSHMERICFHSKDNFFEGRVTGYQLQVEKNTGDEIDDLSFDADF